MPLLIGDVFRNAARARPGRVAAVHGSAALTFGDLDRRANRVARALRRHGVDRHDRVAVWASTTLDVIPPFAALAKLGAAFAPLNAALTAEEAVEMATSARPALLLVDRDRAAAGATVAARLGITSIDLDHLDAAAADEPDGDIEVAVDETDPHVVFFTSGTSGRSKGVVLSHRTNHLRSHPGALLEPRGAMVCPYPLFHMGAWTIALQQWQARATVVFPPSTTGEAIAVAVADHGATRLNAVPALWRRVLDHLADPAGPDDLLASLRFADTGTSSTPIELLQAIAAAAPDAQVRVFYGSTEAGSVATLDHDDIEAKPGSCGLPGPSTEVRIDDTGELLVRGPLVFERYDDPAATAAAFTDDWYRTGDLADVDDDGYLSIVGRVNDMIRTGGEAVVPAEVETVLGDHPAVAEVAVVGLADPDWGEIVCAVIVAAGVTDDADLDLAEMRAHCAGRLAPHKHPRRIEVVTTIPRTPATGQVQRGLLVESIMSAEARP